MTIQTLKKWMIKNLNNRQFNDLADDYLTNLGSKHLPTMIQRSTQQTLKLALTYLGEISQVITRDGKDYHDKGYLSALAYVMNKYANEYIYTDMEVAA